MPNAKQKRKPRNLTEFPLDFVLTNELRDVFAKYNPTATDVEICLQWDKFKAHHQMRGDEFKNWPAAWTYWATHAAQYGFRPRTTGVVEVPAKRPPVPIGEVARTTWLRPAKPKSTEPRGVSLSPEEQQAHVRSLIAGIGNGGHR